MSHKISFRLDDGLYDNLKAKGGQLSDNCRTAIRQYIDGTLPINYQYNDEYTQHLETEVLFLRENLKKMTARIFLLPESNSDIIKTLEKPVLEGNLVEINIPDRKKEIMRPRALKVPSTAKNNQYRSNHKGKKKKERGFWARLFHI